MTVAGSLSRGADRTREDNAGEGQPSNWTVAMGVWHGPSSRRSTASSMGWSPMDGGCRGARTLVRWHFNQLAKL